MQTQTYTHTRAHTCTRPLVISKKALLRRPEQQSGVSRTPTRRRLIRVGEWSPRTGSAYTPCLHALVGAPACVCVCVGGCGWFFQHQRLKPIKDTPLPESVYVCVCVQKYLLPGSIFGSQDGPSASERIQQGRDGPWLLCTSQGPTKPMWAVANTLQWRLGRMQIQFTSRVDAYVRARGCSTHSLNKPTRDYCSVRAEVNADGGSDPSISAHLPPH